MNNHILAPAIIAGTLAIAGQYVMAQAPAPVPPQALKAMDVFLGDWTFTGTIQDGPKGQEKPFVWKLHGRRILGGFAVQIDQDWIEGGVSSKNLEIDSYNADEKVIVSNGWGDDGSRWVTHPVFKNEVCQEDGKLFLPNGKVAEVHWTWTFDSNTRSAKTVGEMQLDGVKWTFARVTGTKAN